MILDMDFRFANEFHVLEMLPFGSMVRVDTNRGGQHRRFFGMKVSQPQGCGASVWVTGGFVLDGVLTLSTATKYFDERDGDGAVEFKPGEVSALHVLPLDRVTTVTHPDFLVRRCRNVVFYGHRTDLELASTGTYREITSASQLMSAFLDVAGAATEPGGIFVVAGHRC